MAEMRRKFDQDFRDGAVRIVLETGKPIVQVARDLGIHEGTLGSWVVKAREASRPTGGQLSTSEREELLRLRKEIAELAMEHSAQALGGPAGDGGDEVGVAGFIACQTTVHQVPHAVACRALGVSESWFYKWRDRPPTPRQQRRQAVPTWRPGQTPYPLGAAASCEQLSRSPRS